MARQKKEKPQSEFKAVMKRFCKNKLALAGMVIFAIIAILAIFAPVIEPYDYADMDLRNTYASPSLQHLCGTDQLGRDIFSRLLYGARYSLGLGFCAQIFTLVFGVIIGSIREYMELVSLWDA